MLKQEILKGESKTMEFKTTLPSNSEKYLKTIIAYSNTSGGKLIIGVDDKTLVIHGVENEFTVMDAIANSISDACEPIIYPEIYPQTIDGKTVIVVEISHGKQTPYYLKAKGKLMVHI